MSILEASIKSPAHKKVYDHWLALVANGESIPAESAFNINDLPDLEPWTVLIEVVEGKAGYRYRAGHIGKGIAERFGRDVSGRFADELYSEDYLLQLSLSYGDAVENARPNIWRCMLETAEGEKLYYDRLILPLADASGEVRTLVSSFAFDSGWGTAYRPAPPGQSTWLKIA